MADGDRIRDSKTQLVGTPAAGKHGIGVEAAMGGYGEDITGTVAAPTWAVCAKGDLVCDFRLGWLDLAVALRLPLAEIPRIALADASRTALSDVQVLPEELFIITR